MDNENKPKTIEELFVSEYYKLKAQNDNLNFDIKYLSGKCDGLSDNFDNAMKAFKALGITLNGNGTISIRNSFVYKTDDGYDELRKIIEQLADDEDDGE